MKILFGIDGIVAEGLKKPISAIELCKIDKRFLYIGTVRDSMGNLIHDAFMHILKPTEFYTIKNVVEIKENIYGIKTERYYFSLNSPVLRYFYDNHVGEMYVGDVCDGTGETGEVWHDTYKMGLDSNIIYIKKDDGSRIIVTPPIENCLSVPDRFGFRIVVKTPNQPQKHYAFFLGISAFNQWTYLRYHAKDETKVLHNLEPDYTKFLYYDECESFEKYPELVKAYPKSYSTKGYLNLNR